MYDAFCYGAISLDISGRLSDPRDEGYQVVATDYRISPGGDAALVAVTLAGMGLKVALGGGPVGDDPIGEYLRDALKELGVTVLAPSFGKTTVASILIGDCEQRSIVTYHEDTEESEIPVQEDAVKHARYVYADGCYARNSAIVGSAARAGHIPSLLNFDALAVANVSTFDTVIASEDSSRLFSKDPEDAAERIYELNNGLAIVTLGEKGCVCCDGAIRHVPAFKVKAVDTTGAGAAFAAGLIYAQMSGKKIDECLRFASASGAIKAISRGSYRLFTSREIEEFAKTHE
jgi:sugar/nucleoside kinase (ribokinase family)